MIRLASHSVLALLLATSVSLAEDVKPGAFKAELGTPGGPIRFDLHLARKADKWSASVVNALETIAIPQVDVSGDEITLAFPHYDSAIKGKMTDGQIVGRYRKRRGPEKWGEMDFRAVPVTNAKPAKQMEFKKIAGRWSVKFSKSEDRSIGVFSIRPRDKQPWGTFLTTTGDYRYLTRQNADAENQIELSVFDGAHAFLFRMELDFEGNLAGEFWSGNSWHERFIGERDPKAELPDAFRLTTVLKGANLNELKYPDLQGNLTSLGDKKFAGKARIIQVFGSWCPNCHDAALYLSKLQKKYGDKGLSIVGLAFEHTGEFERDVEMVRRYMKRHKTTYPVLLAGLSDKGKATQQFPLIDRVRSYPTTIFIRADGTVRAVYTGFSGPATGTAYAKLGKRFEAIINELLETSADD